MKKLYLSLILLLSIPCSFAWDGVDSDTGGSVEIGQGNLGRPGQDIEIYDHDKGEHRDVEVQSIRSYGDRVEVEVYDSDSGEYRSLEMERR